MKIKDIIATLREIRLNVPPVCSGFLKIWYDTRRNQQYFVTRQADSLEQEISLHFTFTNITYETDYEMPNNSGIRVRRNVENLDVG